MKLHPFAELFPPMLSAEYAALKADIAVHGLHDPVVMLDDLILDGRHRARACEELGKRLTKVEYDGDDPLAFVLSRNLHRRHLGESQRALVAARIAELPAHRPGKETSEKSLVQAKAAEMLNISVDLVKFGRKVLTQGTPELIKAVERNRVAVSAAATLTRLPPKDQLAIAAESDEQLRRQLIRDAKDRATRITKAEPPPVVELHLHGTTRQSGKKRYYTVDEWNALSKPDRAHLIDEGFETKGEKMNEQTGTSIEWARWSHNTVTGCKHDCPYCYARDIAERLYPQGFEPTFHPHRLAGPGAIAVPAQATRDESYRNIFANSMSDLFGQWVPTDWIEATLQMATRHPQWNFLTLTKFPQRAAEFTFPKNVWMGTTVDAQARVDNAEKAFTKIRCETKWLSLEPLLEPLKFRRIDLFQWIVIGGASASRKTPAWIPPFDWLADLHRDARAAGCRIYHKTNVGLSDDIRVREFPWVNPKPHALPKVFAYLKGMR